MQAIIPNNSDATFRKRTRMQKPSELLLDYNYGAAAVKLWGHGTDVLQDLTTPVSPPVGPSKKKSDKNVTIKKLKEPKKRKKSRARNAGGEESDKAVWDEDEVMLFLWGNSRAAQERHIKRSEDKRRDVEQWKRGIKYGL